jgi:2-polyprenyl-3-methyl-5-hydroxy-6-metoxy-1,4-benzoquinol methylase
MAVQWSELHIEYDPVKAAIGRWIKNNTLLRRLFFWGLGRMFLREQYIKRELRRIAFEGKDIHNILDAGSGYGQYSWFCAKLFKDANILGVDVMQEQIRDSELFSKKMRLSQCRFEFGDLQTISYDAQFDLILSVDVMEHVPDDMAVLNNFQRALCPGGTLIIHTPTRDPKLPHMDDNEVHSVVGEHVREGYTEEEIRDKLSQAGLTVKKVTFAYGKYGGKAWRLLQGHPMRWVHNRKWLVHFLPLYYLFTYPLGAYWMRKDLLAGNQWGGSIIVLAEKPR